MAATINPFNIILAASSQSLRQKELSHTSTMKLTCALLSATVATATATSFQHGDACGVSSRDFLTYDFRSDFLVAGEEGCTLGDDTQCYCAPDLNDGESLSEWKWQCNSIENTVTFGPKNNKACPESVPVAKGLGDLDVILNRRALQVQERVPCDTAINPTGRPGDEFCPYSDCDEGGDHSAICACIDLGQYGMGDGMEWVCMHATCSCEGDHEVAGEQGENMDISSSVGVAAASVMLLTSALVGMAASI
jgi:hypothetical protein